MGRIYIPLEDMERFGYSEDMLAERKLTPEFRDMMAFEVDRARGLFQRGLELVPTLDGRIKLDIALFSLGGDAHTGRHRAPGVRRALEAASAVEGGQDRADGAHRVESLAAG